LSEDLIFVSGTLGTRGESFELVDGGVAAETRQALENVRRILDSCEATFEDILHCRIYLIDMTGFREMNKAYLEFFPGDPPSRITVGCSALALGASVEIECVAQRPRHGNAPRRRLPRQSSFVELDGQRLYFESVGEGEPLVLCHGAGGNHAVWYQQVPVFARTRRVITWDHRGFGRSTDSTGKSAPDIAVGDLTAILDHLHVDRADLVGQSMGGWTALGFTLEHPDRVRSLTLADTLGGITSPAIERGFQELSARIGDERTDAGGLGQHPALDDSLVGRDPERAYLYQMLGGFGEPDLARILPLLSSTTRPQDALAALRTPVLFIVGDRDPLFPPQLVREAATQLPDARLVEIPGCGHSPYFEAPETWNAVLQQFLASCEA
jgi:pimeloyl-ACP methyl ester carboxylesterase/enamine deaminase RidA (YjgF/YER057c/UK114 family)